MTEPRHSELFTALQAFRSSMARIAGDLGAMSARLREDTPMPWDRERGDVAHALADHAMTLAAGLEVLDRTAGDPDDLEDTAVD